MNSATAKPSSKPTPAEALAIKPADILASAKSALEKHRDAIIRHEESFAASTLGNRLSIGLACLKAHVVFVQTDPGKKNKSGRNQHSKGGHVTRDVASETSFEGWLADEAPWLKKPTAYKYMTALRGLGLDEKATDDQVEATLDTIRHSNVEVGLAQPTLASLIASAAEPVKALPAPPTPPEQQEFAFMRERLKSFREETEHLLSLKDQLLANPDLHKAACARAYAALAELTGTQWAPSEEPDELSSIDPDFIEL